MARPPKEINWDIVEKKMEAGCTAREISAGICEINTFYDRFKEHYGKSFGDYADDYYSVGDGLLKFTQYMKAISGNIPMLQLLGKERLGQGKEQETTPTNDELLDLKYENMTLKHELAKRNNAYKSETGSELC